MDFDQKLQDLFSEAGKGSLFSKAVVGLLYPDGSRKVVSFNTTVNSVFDIASLTKVCPTSTLALKFILSDELSLDTQVIEWIPELNTNYREQILVRHLLTHSLDYRVPMSSLKNLPPQEILNTLFSYQFEKAPGTIFNYGNPASILLGLILARMKGKALNVLGEECFFAPLGMMRSGWNPLSRVLLEDIIPTEKCPWRGRDIQGEIHDESAHTLSALSPVGSAGMFSCIPDLLNFVQMILGDGEFEGRRMMPKGVLKMVSTNALADTVPTECTALGWELNATKFMGTHAGPHAFGKTGFTGASIVADADRKAAVLLLSNFTWPTRESSPDRIHAFRAQLADLFFQSLKV